VLERRGGENLDAWLAKLDPKSFGQSETEA